MDIWQRFFSYNRIFCFRIKSYIFFWKCFHCQFNKTQLWKNKSQKFVWVQRWIFADSVDTNATLSCGEKQTPILIHTDAVDINVISPSDMSVSVTFVKPPTDCSVSKKSLKRLSVGGRLVCGWATLPRYSNQVCKALLCSCMTPSDAQRKKNRGYNKCRGYKNFTDKQREKKHDR